jgi:hypothetical protein
MRDFFQEYLAIPFAIMVMLFLAPTVMLGGITIASHIFGVLPDSPLCEKKVEK